ncbi:MAG: hypothetical protein ACI8W8_002174 [Rhodothermales bacterium]|jgi:hypothetical protein
MAIAGRQWIAPLVGIGLAIAVLLPMQAPAALIGHWTFDEISGGTATDGNNGIWQNDADTALTWALGPVGSAASMVGGGNDKFIRIARIATVVRFR